MAYEIQKNYHTKTSVKLLFLTLACIMLPLSFFIGKNIRRSAVLFLCNYFILFANGLRYGKKFLLSPICLFFSFFYFYANTFPLLYEFGGMNFFSVKESALIFTYTYSLRFLSLAVFLFSITPQIFIVNFSISNTIRQNVSFTLVFVAIALLFIEILYFAWSGYLIFFLNGTTARADINTYVRHYNIWTYLGYFDIFLLLKLFFAKKGRTVRKLTVLLPVAFYYGVNIFSGSRKQLLYILVIIAICYFFRIIKIKKTYFSILLALFFMAVFYRTVVMDKGFQGDVFARIAGVCGEFIFPTITFPLSLQKNFGSENFNYPTLFDSVLYFVPRTIFPLKNYSIGETFSKMMNVNMGFAMNPMLEAYINFGVFGYVFEICLLFIVFLLIKKIAKKNFYIYIFAMIFLIDLNRGEIAFYIRQLITIAMTLWFMNLLFQYLHFAFRIPKNKEHIV